MTRLTSETSGQSLDEYALIIGFVALLVISLLSLFGKQILDFFDQFASGWPVWTTSK